ncbi:LysR family transcriptional regulator [Croceicoccus naphthovorans]|uniref:LysR family transcriptional regulator n=1 Tax=Croceicoccus naphthovorans TaxID=1348774 RepID=A0A0G3XK30_9SPHN|nr:LysR family transcriptional regulator [Croceicoccus naphthovorans]AKM10733.1 LysR family transcriptional regulator [Croceicoccus naphthovorans]MBB3992223.1 DNA-binding transcriptional LysR family regulator [Croceicoccus naphthovorans]
MDHWAEIRMFLAVAEGGTVRAAANALSVNHATVIRGVARLEERLGSTLFDKMPSGYRLTEAGAEIVEQARMMESAASRIEAKAFGHDQKVSGVVRLTLPASFATDLLMPSLAMFKAAFPDIALEVIASLELANLGNREADVALRVVVSEDALPETLYGSRLCGFYSAYYCHRLFLQGHTTPAAWLLWHDAPAPTSWQPSGGINVSQTPVRFTETRSQFEAARAGMGITIAPCFLGDADPLLTRVPGGPVSHHGDIWLLTHEDTRRTKRVRLLCDHLRGAILGLAPRLEGRGVRDPLGIGKANAPD